MSENTSRSAKSAIPLVLAGTAVVIAAVNLYGKLYSLETRVDEMERELKVLQPLVKVMGAHRPELAGMPNPYHANQATGAPDVEQPGADSPRAWCPARENEGVETLQLGYESAPVATAVVIHNTFNPGAVSRVWIAGRDEEWIPLWQGNAPVDFLQTIPISPPRAIEKVRLELELSRVPGWNEIDAVGLVDEQGQTHWATDATASSVWSASVQNRGN